MSCEKYLWKIEERCKAATPGPWLNAYPNACKFTVMPDHVWNMEKELIAKELLEEDAKFIAHSRTDIERLVKMVRCAREAIFLSKETCGILNVAELKYFLDKALTELDRLAGEGK